MGQSHGPGFRLAVLMCAILASAGQVVAQKATNPGAAAVAEFDKQVKAYMDLHRKEEGSIAPVKSGATPAEVLVFEQALAGRIKAARSAAKQGDVFAPDVTPVFKKVFSDFYQRRSGRELRLLFDEVPNFTPQVNLSYLANQPKATFPPRLSLALPQLPEELEYRLVGTSLVLRDTKANLIVDFIPNILPSSAKH
jgi:hypothetical protein